MALAKQRPLYFLNIQRQWMLFAARIAIFQVLVCLTLFVANDKALAADGPATLRKVVLQLPWLHQFQFAGYYAALEQGYYREAGFDVTILEGRPDWPPVPRVIAGEAHYGVARSEILLHRLKGQPVVLLASIFQHSATILLAKKESGIDNPQQMIGKRVMVLEGDDGAEFLAMFLQEGVSPEQITLIPSTFNINDLIEDRTDVFNAYTTNEPYLLKSRGIDISIISPRTYGIDFYGDCLFTSEKELQAYPDQVKAFRRASILGWRYALAHTERLINLIIDKYGVERTRNHLRFEAEAIRRLILPDLVEIGHTNPGRWDHIATTYIDLGMVESDTSLHGFIYAPNPVRYPIWLWRGLFIASLAGMLTTAGAMVLLFLNRKFQKEIVDRRAVENSLRQSESRYRYLFDSINSGVAVYQAVDDGKDFIISDFNKAGEKIEQIKAGDVIGKRLLEVFPGMKDSGLFDAFQQVWKTGSPLHPPLTYYEDDRISGWRDNFIYKLPTGEIVTAYTDETMHKRSEQELALQKDEQTLLIDTIDTQVWYLSEPRTYGAVNKAHADFLGVSKEAVAHKRLDAVRSKKHLKTTIDNNYRVFKTKKSFHTEEWGIHASGQQRLLAVTRTPKLDADNEVAFVVCAGVDITDTKQLEVQVREAHKMKAIGTLSGGVAHEFNNILAIILGNAELAGDDMPANNKGQKFITEIQRASLRGKEVVSQLLNFSREAVSTKKTLCINEIISEAVSFLRASIPSTIEFETALTDELLCMVGDPTQIHQVIINLCTNASHAMEANGGTLNIEAFKQTTDRAEAFSDQELPPGTYIVLKIIDNGHGISGQDVGRIFEPFFTTKDVDKGTGMGLAVVHGIMRSHGGGIRVRSRIDQGTEVECFFPYVSQEPEKAHQAEENFPMGTESILFVDDERSMVKLGKNRLERMGYRVSAYTDPLEAIDAFERRPTQFDLVVSDLAMPKINGDKLIQKLKAKRPDVKAIICTGYSEKFDAAKANQMGADAFIMKPFEKNELARTIRGVLDEVT